jgi:DNA-binding NarL/FixJ family response regulator
MLRKLSKEVSDCYAHAEDCASKAAEACTQQHREALLRLKQSWLNLALSYEFAERLQDFAKENSRRRLEFYGNDQRACDSTILTQREREVADLAGIGLSNKEIARRLDLSEGTIKAHLHAVFRKTGVRSRFALFAGMASNDGDAEK